MTEKNRKSSKTKKKKKRKKAKMIGEKKKTSKIRE